MTLPVIPEPINAPMANDSSSGSTPVAPTIMGRRRIKRFKAKSASSSTQVTEIDPETDRLAEPSEECIVCRATPNSFPRESPTSLCSHPSVTCRPCLLRIIEAGIADSGVIRCPSEDCRQSLEYEDVRKCIRDSKDNQALFDR